MKKNIFVASLHHKIGNSHSEVLETQEFTLCVQHFVAHGDSHQDNATWPPAQCHTFCVLIIRNNHLQRPGLVSRRSEPVINGK